MSLDNARPSGLRRELVSFALIGGSALFVDIAALALALNVFGLDAYRGGVFSFLVAVTYTWYLNRTFTFRDVSRRRALWQWVRFVAANGIGQAVNYSVYAATVTWAPGLAPWPVWLLPLMPYIGKGCGAVAGLGFNFVGSKLLVFRNRA